MKIIIDKDIPFMKGRFPDDTDLVFVAGKEFTKDIVKDADILVVRTRTSCNENLLKGTNVKMICSATIGTDHIDTAWCEEQGIKVVNAPGCNAPGVAQYVFSSLFKAGFDKSNRTLGIIGYGNVGSIVAGWAREMGIKTLVCDSPKAAGGFNDISYATLDELLKESDAVTLHVPLIHDGKFPTYKMIGERELEIMKNGSIIVNSSRGGVVDEKALIKYLDKGKMKGVIDVWENEPEINIELVQKAFIATPHIAGYSAEGKKRATEMVLRKIKETFGIAVDLSGLECHTPINKKITREDIEASYDPSTDSDRLRETPSLFENLRNSYQYRHESLIF